MGTLYKVLKALNSAMSEKQLSIAIILGMFSGFLPISSLIHLDILFIVFIFNIPVGIYLLSVVLFSSLGFILDPMFSSLGVSILTNDSLNSFFTLLYNNVWFLWSGFNYSTTMGALVVSLILAIPMYFIFNKLLKGYRNTLQKVFKNSKFFGWLNPYREQNTQVKQGVFRLSGLIIISSLFGLVITFVIVFFDPIVKYVLIKTIHKSTDVKVQIDSLSTSWSEGKLELKNIIVVKDNQSTKIDKIICDIDSSRVLKKQLHISLVDIQNISFIQKAIAVKAQKEYIKMPSFNSIKDIQAINFDGNINTVATNKVEEYIKTIKDGLEKIKPYLKSDNQDKAISKERTIGQYILFKNLDNSPTLQINQIKVNGKIEKKNIQISKKLVLEDNVIDFKIDVDSKNINDVKLTNNFTFVKTNINFKATNKNEKIVSKVLSEVKKFYINSKLNLSVDNPKKTDIHINSNLDKILKDKFKNVLKDELKNKAKAKIKSKVEEKLKGKMGDKVQNIFKKFF